MTDLAQQTVPALERLRTLLTSTYNGSVPEQQVIDHVYVDGNNHVVLEGSTGGEFPGLLHSKTGRTAQEVLDSYDRRL